VSDAYLIGIKNLQAETLEYKNRVTAEGEAVSARLEAEGEALLAKVQGEYEAKLNALFGSPAGRAYVAWQAAANISFAKDPDLQLARWRAVGPAAAAVRRAVHGQVSGRRGMGRDRTPRCRRVVRA
jgi:hypothetical protein